MLKYRTGSDACVFLAPDDKQCTVHDARPSQCVPRSCSSFAAAAAAAPEGGSRAAKGKGSATATCRRPPAAAPKASGHLLAPFRRPPPPPRPTPNRCSTYPWWPELVAEDKWARESVQVCEGMGHVDAGPTDVPSAAAQLREATVQDTLLRLARWPATGGVPPARPSTPPPTL